MDVGVGSRVEVVFAGRRVRGLVVELAATTDVEPGRLRDLRRAFGDHPWLTPEEIEVLRWAAHRYASPLAAVVRHALPNRVVDVERRARDQGWWDAPRPADPEPPDVDLDRWDPYGTGLVDLAREGSGSAYWRPLPGEELAERVRELVGVALAAGRDVLLVVAEPVSSVADAVVAAHPELAVDVRGRSGDRATYRAWLRARRGQARLVVGERGVALWPLSRLGLGIVVEEASPALKEQRTPRHHARDVVLERCRRVHGAAVLVGQVPSAIAWRLLAERRLAPVVPAAAVERGRAPVVRVDDRSDPRSVGRLGTAALGALRRALDDGRLGVVLSSRRGEGRALACTTCGLRAACPRCDSSLALPDTDGGPPSAALCEGCGWEPAGGTPTCARCGARGFAPLAAGARRLGDELRRTFPDADVAVLEGYAQPAPPPPAIVVMTRGSALVDPPGDVGTVVLPDMEAMLRRPTLDAAEDALRVAMRTASWTAGAAGTAPGERSSDRLVVVQAREPDHHAVQALVRWDPGGFWRTESARRAELRFPPAAYALRLDVGGDGTEVGAELRSALPAGDEVLGPRSDGSRAGLLVKSADRVATLDALDPLRRGWSERGVDVRVDVDPVT